MSTNDPKVQVARAALEAMIANSVGDLHDALVLFRDETVACSFWLGEAEALMGAVMSAMNALPDGPVRQGLLDAIRAAHHRMSDYQRGLAAAR